MRVLVSNEPADAVGVRQLGGLDGAELLLYAPDSGQLDEQQRAADVLVPPYHGSRRARRLLDQLPALRMVQLLSAGADRWTGYMPAGVTLSTARGAHAGPVSEWAMSAVLALLRRWPDLVRHQDAETWARGHLEADTLAGKRVLVLGAGHIGRAVVDKLSPFGATATLVGQRARSGVHGVDELPALLSEHAVVVIAAPLTDQTRGLVDTTFLAAMPDGALLVNAGRGAIVDTAALHAEVATGRLRAALDVTDPEPLPPGHPLWHCPGVLISPHVARTVSGTARLCYQVAAEQIAAYSRGETRLRPPSPSCGASHCDSW